MVGILLIKLNIIRGLNLIIKKLILSQTVIKVIILIFLISKISYLSFAENPDVSLPFSPVIDSTNIYNRNVALNAQAYVLEQQQSNGCFKSYDNSEDLWAHTFDQALVLTTISYEIKYCQTDHSVLDNLKTAARNLIVFLTAKQNSDGSWYNGYHYQTGQVLTYEKSVGVVSWIVNSLSVYNKITNDTSVLPLIEKGWEWCKSMFIENAVVNYLNIGGQLIPIAITESNIDAWFTAKILGDEISAAKLEQHLISMWNTEGGYFNAGKNVKNGNIDTTPYLDNQTWGSRFLKNTGRDEHVKQALAFGLKNFSIYKGHKLSGLDSLFSKQAVNYEFTCHYIVTRSSKWDILIQEVNSRQHADGGLPHDSKDIPDPWHSTMVGINSTCWLYSANMGISLLELIEF